jgi:hypothetical protein
MRIYECSLSIIPIERLGVFLKHFFFVGPNYRFFKTILKAINTELPLMSSFLVV